MRNVSRTSPRVLAALRGAALVAAIGAVLPACPGQPEGSGRDPAPLLVSRGTITASLNRYIDTGSDEPFEQFGMMGIFARYDIDDARTVEGLLGGRDLDVDIPLDTCSMPAPALEDGNLPQPRSGYPIELLDVGDLTVSFDGGARPVSTRTFPDLLKVIVGVIYTADESRGFLFQPTRTYDVKTTGTDEVAAFRVALEAPEDLGDVKVDGVDPADQAPLVRRGDEVELSWEGDGFGDEVVAVLSWTSMGAPWSMTCRMRDDGFFVVPGSVTAALPDGTASSDAELTLSRVRQVAFRSAGLSSGAFRFVISSYFPVVF